MSAVPVVWSIAGSDSGGGAGIQADIKCIHAMGCHPCTVVTAITAQNTIGVQRIRAVAASDIARQLESLTADLPPAAVKIGMVPDISSARVIRDALENIDCPVVLDPVLAATSGARLSNDDSHESIWLLAGRASVICPNLLEASTLLGRVIERDDQIEEAAREFIDRGCRAVLIKGGHRNGPLCQDYFRDASGGWWFSNHRVDTPNVHGTGCTQSSALAVAMALGFDRLTDAVVLSRMTVHRAIRCALSIGAGPGPVCAQHGPPDAEDLPWATRSADEGRNRFTFPRPGDTPIGLYPCVEDAQWVARLGELGVDTIQLRNKTLTGNALSREVGEAVEAARRHGVRLFVNDYWDLAIRHGAFGVHLGQEDLDDADIGRIAAAGLRLGVSTHCHFEVARAHALRPSYIACGPIWKTEIKKMAFLPQGIDALRGWRRLLCGYPLVAIGGINAERAAKVAAAGVEGISLIRAITQAEDYVDATRTLLRSIDTGRAASSAPVARQAY